MSDAIDPEMNAFEASLRSLSPASSATDADDLIFRAGQRSVLEWNRCLVRRWAFSNAITAALCLSLGTALWSEQDRRFALQSEVAQANEQIRTPAIAARPLSAEASVASIEASESPLLRHAAQLRQALAEGPEAVFSNAGHRDKVTSPRPIPTSRSTADFFGI